MVRAAWPLLHCPVAKLADNEEQLEIVQSDICTGLCSFLSMGDEREGVLDSGSSGFGGVS